MRKIYRILVFALTLAPFARTIAQPIVYPDEAAYNILNFVDIYNQRNGISGTVTINDGVTDAAPYIQFAIDSLDASDDIYGAPLTWNNPLYFPPGVYLVSKTVFVRHLPVNFGATGSGMTIALMGAGEDYTTIKLADGASGFNNPAQPKPVVSFAGEEVTEADSKFTNIAFMNNMMDMTVNTGNNPGASGVRFVANNQGSMRNIKIVGNGWVGIDMDRAKIPGPALVKNVEIDGFQYGVRVAFENYSMTLENIHVKNASKSAIYNHRNTVNVRNLTTENIGETAVINAHEDGSITIIDSDLQGPGSGYNAFENDGFLFARNVTMSGYDNAIRSHSDPLIAAGTISEYYYSQNRSLFGDAPATSLNLPIEETPDAPLDPANTWVNVTDPMFSPDENTPFIPSQPPFRIWDHDIGPYIENAIAFMNKPGNESRNTLYFPPGRYLLEKKNIVIEGNVKRIVGNFAGISTKKSIELDADPVFIIKNTSHPELYLERLFFPPNGCFGCPVGGQGDRRKKMAMFENQSSKDVVMRNMYIGHGKAYVNAGASGRLFLEDVAALSHAFYAHQSVMHEVYQEAIIQFEFGNQHVWARQFDPEQQDVRMETDGGQLWVFGLKTEQVGPNLVARNGAKAELLGGFILPTDPINDNEPAFIIEESEVTIAGVVEHAGNANFGNGGYYKRIITERKNGEERHLERIANNTVPSRLSTRYTFVIPFYSSSTGNFSCPSPDFPLVYNFSREEAILDWDDTQADSYNVQYRVVGTEVWTTENTPEDQYQLTGLTIGEEYEVRVASVCGGQTSLYSKSNFFTKTKGPNLALGRPVLGDSEGDFGNGIEYPDDNVVDGNHEDGSRWLSAPNGSPSWLEVTLDAVYEVGEADLYLGFNNNLSPTNFKLQYIDPLGSPTAWIDIPGASKSGIQPNDNYQEVIFTTPVTTNKIRFTSTDDFVRMREFELYQSGTTDFPSTTLATLPSVVNVGDVVELSATATATAEGASITQVEFFYGANSIGIDPTANGSGNYTFNWTAVEGSHSITARATDDQGNSSYSEAQIITVGGSSPSGSNIALNKPVSGRELNADNALVEAVDGSTGTEDRWMSQLSTDTLTIDLQGTYDVESISVYLGDVTSGSGQIDRAPESFYVEYLNASGSWTLISETSVSNNATNNVEHHFTFPAITTTSVRFIATAGSQGNNFIRLREIEVYGEQGQDSANPKGDISVSTTSQSESNGAGITISVTTDEAVVGDQTFGLSVSGVNASDYSLSNTTITIADNTTTGSVTLNIVDDLSVEGDETIEISVTNPSPGIAYGSTTSVSVTIIDDEVAGFSVSESDGSTSVAESGTTDDISVVLTSAPVGMVTLNVSSSDAGEVTVSSSSLTFDATNWNVGQSITVTGVDDADLDGSQSADVTISIDAANTVDAFDHLADQVVSVSNADDEVPSCGNSFTVSAENTYYTTAPEDVLDGTYAESWAYEVPSGGSVWFQAAFECLKTVEEVKIIFQKAHLRYAIFDIQVSTDGSTFTTIMSDVNSNIITPERNDPINNTFFEVFALPAGTQATHLRLVGYGNSVSGWFNIAELAFTFEGDADTEAPSVPVIVGESNVTDSGFDISWNASTDNVGVDNYEVFLNGASQGTVSTTSYSFSGLQESTSYTVTVNASDAAGNTSALSTGYVVQTSATPDTQAPSVPSGFTESNLSDSGFDISWNASTDNVGVDNYEVFLNGASQGTVSTTSYSFSGLQESTSYTVTVNASDAADNTSALSTGYVVQTSATPDTQAPSVPSGFTESNLSDSGFDISWNASTDNVGVDNYEVFLNGASQGTVSTTSYSFSGLQESTSYTVTVNASDAAGNTSALSAGYQVTTNPLASCGNGVTPSAQGDNTIDGLNNSGWTAWAPGNGSATIDYAFECAKQVTGVNIIWWNRHNADYQFDIEASTDGGSSFSNVSGSTITSARLSQPSNNSVVASDYESYSISSASAVTHIRIRIYGKNGNSSGSVGLTEVSFDFGSGSARLSSDELVSEIEAETNNTISVFPNPVSTQGYFIIERHGFSDENLNIVIRDVSGKFIDQLVMKGNTAQARVSTEKLKKGIYLIQVNSNNGLKYAQRLFVDR